MSIKHKLTVFKRDLKNAKAPGKVDIATALLEARRNPRQTPLTAAEIQDLAKTKQGRSLLDAHRRVGWLHESAWPRKSP